MYLIFEFLKSLVCHPHGKIHATGSQYNLNLNTAVCDGRNILFGEYYEHFLCVIGCLRHAS